MLSIRPYQQDCINAIRQRWNDGIDKQLVTAATGTGKGVLFASLYKGLSLTKRLLILVHLETLCTQAAEKLRQWNRGLSIGIEMGNSSAGNADVVVGSVATLGRRNSPRLAALNPEDFEVVVVDETHHLPAKSYQSILQHFGLLKTERVGPPLNGERVSEKQRARLLLGLTATPVRSDGKTLDWYFDELVFDFPILKAIEQGWLSDIAGVRVRTSVDINRVKVRYGDFDLKVLEKTINIKVRNQLVVDKWLEYGKGKPTVVFCSTINHARSQAVEFQLNGINADLIWGTDPEKNKKLALFEQGKIEVLTNCVLLTEGWDYPNLQCICMAAPTQSLLRYQQMLGRGTRLQDGINNLHEARAQGLALTKQDCLVLDFVDNSSKHSLATLPLVFGLNSNLDLAGQSVTQSLASVKAKKEQHPDIDFSQLQIISDLDSYIERVNLFTKQTYVAVTPSWVRSKPQAIRYNLAKLYARNILGQAQLNTLTEGQVNAILRAKGQQLRDAFKDVPL